MVRRRAESVHRRRGAGGVRHPRGARRRCGARDPSGARHRRAGERSAGSTSACRCPCRCGSGSTPVRSRSGTAMDRNIVIGAEVNLGARLQQAAEPGEILAGPPRSSSRRKRSSSARRARSRPKGSNARSPVAGRRAPPAERRPSADLVGEPPPRARAAQRRLRAGRHARTRAPGDAPRRTGDRQDARREEFLRACPTTTKVLAGRSSPFEEEVDVLAGGADGLSRDRSGRVDAPAPPRSPSGCGRPSRNGWTPGDVDDGRPTPGVRARVGEEVAGRRTATTPPKFDSGVLSRARRARVAEARWSWCSRTCSEADPLLLDLIEQLVREARRVRSMVVCVARREFLEARPNWAGGSPTP